MRFTVMVPADANSEAGKMPDEKVLADMMKYNEQLETWGSIEARCQPAFVSDRRRRKASL
jgi:hypothetical protein